MTSASVRSDLKGRAKVKKRMLVDHKSYDLAQHFLQDIPASPDDVRNLAEVIQRAVEDFLSERPVQ